jgi:hypothetical protein
VRCGAGAVLRCAVLLREGPPAASFMCKYTNVLQHAWRGGCIYPLLRLAKLSLSTKCTQTHSITHVRAWVCDANLKNSTHYLSVSQNQKNLEN